MDFVTFSGLEKPKKQFSRSRKQKAGNWSHERVGGGLSNILYP